MEGFKNVCQEKTSNGFVFVVDHPDIRTFTTTMLTKSGKILDTRTYTTYRGAMKRYYSLLADYGADLRAALFR